MSIFVKILDKPTDMLYNKSRGIYIEGVNNVGTVWRSRGACLNSSPELFFPIGHSEKALEQEQEAIAICNACPVKDLCLETSLIQRRDFGIWGGMTERDRKTIVRRYDTESRREKKKSAMDISTNDFHKDIMSFYRSIRPAFEQKRQSNPSSKATSSFDADLSKLIDDLETLNDL